MSQHIDELKVLLAKQDLQIKEMQGLVNETAKGRGLLSERMSELAAILTTSENLDGVLESLSASVQKMEDDAMSSLVSLSAVGEMVEATRTKAFAQSTRLEILDETCRNVLATVTKLQSDLSEASMGNADVIEKVVQIDMLSTTFERAIEASTTTAAQTIEQITKVSTESDDLAKRAGNYLVAANSAFEQTKRVHLKLVEKQEELGLTRHMLFEEINFPDDRSY